MNAFALLLIKESLSTPKTFSELLEKTRMPERTLRYNLSVLKKSGLLREVHVLSDFRKKMFVLDRTGGAGR